jgi:hypothetical protein
MAGVAILALLLVGLIVSTGLCKDKNVVVNK